MEAKEQFPAPWERPSGGFGCPQRLSGSKRIAWRPKAANNRACNSEIRGTPNKIARNAEIACRASCRTRCTVWEDTMNFRTSGVLAIAAFVGACLLGNAQTRAQNAYITNEGDNSVSVIDTTTNPPKVTAKIRVGHLPIGVAV